MLDTLERQRAGTRLPGLNAENLGDESFRRDHRLRYAYVAGAMANGIASTRLVAEMARAGMLSFFGAAGLGVERIESAIDELARAVPGAPYGFNLIHSPNEPDLEAQVVDLYLRREIRLVEASAYLRLTLPVVRYRVSGIRRDADGRVVTPNRIIAKVSRVEVATQFFSPPPQEFLDELVRQGEITPEQSLLAALVPMAQDLTAEADSGGHTDNRPLVTLLPTLLALRALHLPRVARQKILPRPALALVDRGTKKLLFNECLIRFRQGFQARIRPVQIIQLGRSHWEHRAAFEHLDPHAHFEHIRGRRHGDIRLLGLRQHPADGVR